MSLNTLAPIDHVIANYVDDKTLRTSIEDFFLHYKKEQWLYPAVLVQKFRCPLGTSYRIMHDMEKEGFLKSYYEMVCPCCGYSALKVEVFNQIPDRIICERCETEFSAIENSRIIFQVIHDVR